MNIAINKVLILFLLVNTSLAGFSQKFKGGIHVGLLVTQVDGDEHSGYKKAGLFVGGFVNYPFEKVPLVLQLELNYAQKGSKNNAIQYKISTHQIEMPLLLMWNCWKGLHIDLGFYFCDLGGIAGLHYAIKEKFIVGGRFNYSLSPIGVNAIVRNAKKVQTYMWSNALLFYVAYQF